MKIDIYTKIILTIIAVCLVTQVLRPTDSVLINQAYASDFPSVLDVNIVKIDGNTVGGYNGALPVKIEKD